MNCITNTKETSKTNKIKSELFEVNIDEERTRREPCIESPIFDKQHKLIWKAPRGDRTQQKAHKYPQISVTVLIDIRIDFTNVVSALSLLSSFPFTLSEGVCLPPKFCTVKPGFAALAFGLQKAQCKTLTKIEMISS